jgi:hypothetical protein
LRETVARIRHVIGEWFDIRDLATNCWRTSTTLRLRFARDRRRIRHVIGCSSADVTTGADEKADQEVHRKTLPGVSRNWLSPSEAAGETGAADICGSLCEMQRQGPRDRHSSEPSPLVKSKAQR